MQILDDANAAVETSSESVFPCDETAKALNEDAVDSVPAVG